MNFEKQPFKKDEPQIDLRIFIESVLNATDYLPYSMVGEYQKNAWEEIRKKVEKLLDSEDLNFLDDFFAGKSFNEICETYKNLNEREIDSKIKNALRKLEKLI